MEKVSRNTVNKKQNGLEQIGNEKTEKPSYSSSLTSLGSLLPKAVNELST